MSLRIGLLAHDFLTWQGGTDFLDVVARSLCASSAKPRLFLFLPTKGPRVLARSLRLALRHWLHQPGSTLKWRSPDRDFELSELSQLPFEVERVWLDIGQRPLLEAAKKNKVDILLPAVHSLGDSFPVPWIGYAYDFQHRHLPHFFSEKDRRSRDEHFHAIFSDPPLVLVNSKAVANDATAFVQDRKAEVCVLPFTPLVRKSWSQLDGATSHLYRQDPSTPFFLVSNQLWPHKNHRLVCQAADILLRAGHKFQVLCTGAMNTAETSPVADALMREFKELFSSRTVCFLGWIPKNHQIDLLLTANALIQPSKFEGGPGGGAAYHAAALQRPILLSDIPVNREIYADETMFFCPENPNELAAKMQLYLAKTGKKKNSWNELLKCSNQAAERCGDLLFQSAEKVVQRYKGRP